jgi:hypothetical protein
MPTFNPCRCKNPKLQKKPKGLKFTPTRRCAKCGKILNKNRVSTP